MHKRENPAGTAVMNGLGKKLLSSTGFPGDQHIEIIAHGANGKFLELPDGSVFTDNIVSGIARRQQGGEFVLNNL